jgi:hypothetical protein
MPGRGPKSMVLGWKMKRSKGAADTDMTRGGTVPTFMFLDAPLETYHQSSDGFKAHRALAASNCMLPPHALSGHCPGAE